MTWLTTPTPVPEQPRTWGGAGRIGNRMPGAVDQPTPPCRGPVLPDEIQGAAYLERFGGIDDRLTAVEPNVAYPVRAATQFGVEEDARARGALALLRSGEVSGLGPLLDASHRAYSAMGLGHPATDRIVEDLATRPGVFGAGSAVVAAGVPSSPCAGEVPSTTSPPSSAEGGQPLLPSTTVTVHPSFAIGRVDPRIFGGFLEHMGRAVYGGISTPTAGTPTGTAAVPTSSTTSRSSTCR